MAVVQTRQVLCVGFNRHGLSRILPYCRSKVNFCTVFTEFAFWEGEGLLYARGKTVVTKQGLNPQSAGGERIHKCGMGVLCEEGPAA